MKKRILSLLSAIAFVFLLSSCSNDGEIKTADD